MFILFLEFMSFEYFIQLTIAIFMVLVTVIIAVNNHKLTNNNEKFNHANLIVDFQDKLSNAILSEQELIKNGMNMILGIMMMKYSSLLKQMVYLKSIL